mgnify:CR=1 FL=1
MGLFMMAATAACSQPINTPPSPTGTAFISQTENVQTPSSNLKWITSESSTSPDSSWVAETAYILGEATTQTRIVVTNTVGAPVWRIEKQWELDPGVIVGTRVLRWSRNGLYLYFTTLAHVGGCATLTNGSDLQRLELATGEVKEIAPLLGYPIGTWLALSPDDTILAYPKNSESNTIILRDLATGLQRSIDLDLSTDPNYRLGYLEWTPDGSFLALTVAIDPCIPTGEPWTATSVVLIDVASLHSKFVVKQDSRLLVTEGWADNTHLLLKDQAGKNWIYNLEDDRLTP